MKVVFPVMFATFKDHRVEISSALTVLGSIATLPKRIQLTDGWGLPVALQKTLIEDPGRRSIFVVPETPSPPDDTEIIGGVPVKFFGFSFRGIFLSMGLIFLEEFELKLCIRFLGVFFIFECSEIIDFWE